MEISESQVAMLCVKKTKANQGHSSLSLPPCRLCSDLQSLIQERAEIEKAYAKSLRSWSKRWGEIIEKGPEYGTIEAAWKGVLTEADRLSEVHLNMKDDLCGDVSNMIKTWQKDNYHKTMIHIKERKEMEDLFKKAQKPWAKHLAKVEKTKTEYHNACKMEKSATNLERNATGDSSLSPDQVNDMDRAEMSGFGGEIFSFHLLSS